MNLGNQEKFMSSYPVMAHVLESDYTASALHSVLEESETTGSYEGNYVLAVFKTPEKYAFLKMALEDIKDVEAQAD